MEFAIGYCCGIMMAFALAWLFFSKSIKSDLDQRQCDKRLEDIEPE